MVCVFQRRKFLPEWAQRRLGPFFLGRSANQTGGNVKDAKGRNLKDGESQRPDGRYMFRWTDSNGTRRMVYSWKLVSTDIIPSGKRNDISLREKEEEIHRDQLDGVDKNRIDTVNDLFWVWLKGKRNCKDHTKAIYRQNYERYVEHASFGKKKVRLVKYSSVRYFYQSLLDGGISSSTLRILHTALHSAFDIAVRDGDIRTNPTDGAIEVIRGMDDNKKVKALSIQEEKTFLDFLTDYSPVRRWRPLFVVLFETGLRIGECLGLTWADVSMRNKTISVTHTLFHANLGDGKYFHVGTPKTKTSIREIPMTKEVWKAFRELQEDQRQNGFCTDIIDGYSGFIFLTGTRHPYVYSNIDSYTHRLIKQCNQWEEQRAKEEGREPVIVPQFSIHACRHTFATRLCENDVNIKAIQSIMGHSSISTTMDIYAEATKEKKEEAIQSLEGLV